ncbi:MAG TPA: nuclear transport factor 2 family protein [Vicinamibacterales bacterium]|nr:nuclear transport factor 2 family protein [Vicinamibacterales bacterium]
MPHANALLIERLFDALNRHDHDTMAGCYHEQATFDDIAFHLRRKQRIHEMWRMLCEGDSGIRVDVTSISADDRTGVARVIDKYHLGHDTPVTSPITSRFAFRDGRIISQVDESDARAWARQAIGGTPGWIIGRSALLRSLLAAVRLQRFRRARTARHARVGA